MKLVVGLGNPGRKYDGSRHNVGFMVISQLAKMVAAGVARDRFDGEISEGTLNGQKVAVLCPMTYMNASGRCVRKAVDFYKLSLDGVLIVCDDFNLPLGQLRIRSGGSSGGQKGLTDIIRHLRSDSVPRLRVGIDPPPVRWSIPDYVLSKFKAGEQPEVDAMTQRSAFAAADWVVHGIDYCMNQYNAKN